MAKGLALHKSLMDHAGDFTLHWLCTDEDCFSALKARNLKNVVIYSLADVESADLTEARNNPPSKYGTQYSQFCWTLTPYFTHHVLQGLQPHKLLIYVDADIFFYRSPQIILDIVGDKSVGIHTHRFTPPFKDTPTGWYNVGVVVFRNDLLGGNMCADWKRWMLNPGNEYYETHGSCGDQKYLDLFPELLKENLCVFDDERCSHLAPWCSSYLSHLPDKKIVHNGKESPVVFFHFSHFTIKGEAWSDSINGEWRPARDNKIRPDYEEYFRTIKGLTHA